MLSFPKVHDIEHIAEKVEIDFHGEIEFQIETGKEDYGFGYRLTEDDEWIELGTAKTAGLCTEGTMMMTFTGTYLGIFASNTEAYFEYFSAGRNKAYQEESDMSLIGFF